MEERSRLLGYVETDRGHLAVPQGSAHMKHHVKEEQNEMFPKVRKSELEFGNARTN